MTYVSEVSHREPGQEKSEEVGGRRSIIKNPDEPGLGERARRGTAGRSLELS